MRGAGKKPVDIIFCSLPYGEVQQVYGAPAILKSVVQAEGYTAKTKDFGLELFKLCDRNYDKFTKLQSYFLSSGNPLDQEEQSILDRLYDQIIRYFQNNPSTWIGISVFSVYTHKATLDVVERLRQAGNTSKIVLGGRGVSRTPYSSTFESFDLRSLEKVQNFGQVLMNRKLVDQVVIGDGEDAILRVLRDEIVDAQNNLDTFEYPIPDYDDYDLSSYVWNKKGVVFPITGSRGCVRDCDFCDVREQFGKYRYRQGKDIANEMIRINQQYGYNNFIFTDSLVNGGLRPLEEFCTAMADHNEQNPDNKITWSGQYICREEKYMPERLYALMARSGAEGLTIGAESGSDHVLEHMNKKTTVTALFHELEMFRKYNITSTLLTFTGHWAETDQDFLEHCRFLVRCMPYVRSGTISYIILGSVAWVLDGTPSMEEVRNGDIVQADFEKESLWYARYNPSLTLRERIWRRLVVGQICRELNYPVNAEIADLSSLNILIEQNHREINDFYRKCLEQV